MVNNLRKSAQKYIQFLSKNKWVVFITAILIFTASCWYTSTHLRLNNDLSSLLPKNTPSVIALNESLVRFGSSDKFMIALQGNNLEEIVNVQELIKADIERDWQDIMLNVQIERNNQFFEDNALLYLPSKHLERIRDNLLIIKDELGGAINPLMVDFEDDVHKIDEQDSTVVKENNKTKSEELVWFESSIPQELGLPDEAASAFDGFYQKETNKSSDTQPFDKKAILPDSLKNRFIGQHHTDKTINGVVLVKLVGSSTNLNFTEKVLDRTKKMLAPYNQKFPELRISVKGSYEGLTEVKGMKLDGLVSVAISFVLMIGLIFYLFRSFVGVFMVLGQVVFAAGVMMFFTSIFYGQLNPYTLFVFSIIMGMGIDFSIHLMGTAQRMRNEFQSLNESLVETIVHLMYPMFLASLTTIAGLLTLLIADFKGFYEFGVIAAIGVGLSFITAILGLPLLILLNNGLPIIKNKELIPSSWSEIKTKVILTRSAYILTLVIVLLMGFFPWAEFEHNFKNLRAPKAKTSAGSEPEMHTGAALSGKRKSSQPAAIMGDNVKELEQLHDTLLSVLNIEKDPFLKSFLTLKTFVPPQEEQEERMEIIEEINDIIGARIFNKVTGENAEKIEKLRKMVDIEPFTTEKIPQWALDVLKEKDGTYGKIGYIYGKYKSWNAHEMQSFQDKFSHWNFGGKDLRVYSSAFILTDVISSVKKDSLKMGVFILIVIAFILGFALRSGKMVLISIVSIGSAVLLCIGFMGVTNFTFGLGKISIYNVIVIPMALGVGIDATIHLMIAYVTQTEKGIKYIYNTTGKMVLFASLTTVAGFVGILFISHKGMRTIGELAVIAVLATLITAFIYTPFLSIKLLGKKQG